VIATQERAKRMSRDGSVARLVSFGEARGRKGYMPEAAVPAARGALAAAGLTVGDIDAFKIHDPFAVNDLYFCQEMGVAPERVNRFGSSLIYGHPQAPTGLRGVIELIEELQLRGGGYGLFSGCSAGDSAAALVLEVMDA
jgi:acetyl-CoA C-acetyltransferase